MELDSGFSKSDWDPHHNSVASFIWNSFLYHHQLTNSYSSFIIQFKRPLFGQVSPSPWFPSACHSYFWSTIITWQCNFPIHIHVFPKHQKLLKYLVSSDTQQKPSKHLLDEWSGLEFNIPVSNLMNKARSHKSFLPWLEHPYVWNEIPAGASGYSCSLGDRGQPQPNRLRLRIGL